MVDVIDFNKAKCIVELELWYRSLYERNYEEKEEGNNISSY